MFGSLRKLLHREISTGKRQGYRPRLNVELLEDRLTPAHVSFAPVAVFSVNPAPLPPVALVQFAPLVQLPSVPPPLSGSTLPIPVQIQGTSTQTLSSPVSTTPTWSLSLSYALQGSVTEGLTPAATLNPPGFIAHFSLAGQITETLYKTSPAVSSGWHITANISENGTVSMPPQANPVANLFSVNAAVTLSQTETAFYPPGVLPPVSLPWLVQANLALTGTSQETLPPAPVATGNTIVAAFSLHDQITESLMLATTGTGSPTPVYVIVGQSSATGSTTVTLTPPATTGSPWVASGIVQYLEDLSETISDPSGTTQTLTQEYESLGQFLNNEFEFGL